MKAKDIARFLHEFEETRAKLSLAEGLRDLGLFNIQVEKLRTLEVKISSFPNYIKNFHVRYGNGHCSLQDYISKYRIDSERRSVIHRLVWM